MKKEYDLIEKCAKCSKEIIGTDFVQKKNGDIVCLKC